MLIDLVERTLSRGLGQLGFHIFSCGVLSLYLCILYVIHENVILVLWIPVREVKLTYEMKCFVYYIYIYIIYK